VVPVHLFVASLLGWLHGEQHKVVEYLREENRVLKAQLHSRRVQLTDDDRGAWRSWVRVLVAGSWRTWPRL
jgi:hypothetical protein